MSNTRYQAQVEAMFARFNDQLEQIGKRYTSNMLFYLLYETPGPGNQNPPDTQYLATGNLRQKWDLTTGSAPSETADWDQSGGDLSTDGRATASRLSDDLMAIPRPKTLTVYNTCAYGYLVHEGLGYHNTPRPFTQWAVDPTRAQNWLNEAIAEVMGHG